MSVLCERTSELPAPAAAVWSWHERPHALERLLPPWQPVRVVRCSPPGEGSRVELLARLGPVWMRTVHEHFNVFAGRSFCDRQVRGPFRQLVHRHTVAPAATPERSLLAERLELVLPGGAPSQRLLGRLVEREVDRSLAYRHRVLAADLARQAPWQSRPRLAVAISGASGTIGRALAVFLANDGHRVIRLVRHRRVPAADEARVDAYGELVDRERLEGVDAVIHLAGETIARRFTRRHRLRIEHSRIDRTRALVTSLAQLTRPPRSFFSASAVGFYGTESELETDEDGVPGTGFLADVCRRWEEAAQEASSFGARTVLLRFGLVLTPRGGALAALLPAARCGLAGRLGHGRQMVSWIALDDAIYAIYHLLMARELAGPFNLVAPEPTTQEQLVSTLAAVLSRRLGPPAPSWLLRAALGEMARETLLASSSVVPKRLLRSRFVFSQPDLEQALRHDLGHT